MTTKDFRQSAALQAVLRKEAKALVDECWPAVRHWCAYCGLLVRRDEASAHHLVAREEGGSDRTSNLVLVHKGRCHDGIEKWTEVKGRPPAPSEWGRIRGDDNDNTLTPGVGTAPQPKIVFAPEPPLSVADVPRYLQFLARIDRLYRVQIKENPGWGMWVYKQSDEKQDEQWA